VAGVVGTDQMGRSSQQQQVVVQKHKWLVTCGLWFEYYDDFMFCIVC